jgi:hypothetical protein
MKRSTLFWLCGWLLLAASATALAADSLAAEKVEIAVGESPANPQQPQVAVDDAGAIHLTFGVNNSVRYCRSTDGGASFSTPVEVASEHVISLGMRRGPRIAAAGKAICISVVGGKQGKGRDGDLLAFTSLDDGKTWQGPAMVNDVPDAVREGLHGMAAGPQGELACVWLDLRTKGAKIWSATSADGGRQWSANRLVYSSPDGKVCECCHPSVTFAADGRLIVMWRNSLGGNRDMYVSTSRDGGKSFSTAAKLGSGTWPLKACPMDGGSVAVSPGGEICTAWRRDRNVFLAQPGTAAEINVGAGRNPWTTATADGQYTVWIRDRHAPLMLLAPGVKRPRELAAKANDPVIASAPNGKGPVLVAWEEQRGKGTAIVCERIAEAK